MGFYLNKMAKVGNFFKNQLTRFYNWGVGVAKPVALDYKFAALDTLADIKARPAKAIFYLSLCSGGYIAYRTVPSEKDYHAGIVEASNDLLLVADSIKNKNSDAYVQKCLYYECKGLLRYQHFGLFSLVYYSEQDINNKSYIATCKYSNPRWTEFHKYIVDIGFVNTWWKLQWEMVDFDIDFEQLPKDFDKVYDKYFDFIKRAFGYSFYSDLVAQPSQRLMYVNMEEDAGANKVA